MDDFYSRKYNFDVDSFDVEQTSGTRVSARNVRAKHAAPRGRSRSASARSKAPTRKSPGQPRRNRRGSRTPNRVTNPNKKIIAFLIIIAVVILGVVLFFNMCSNNGVFRFSDDVTVGGIKVGNMTYEEAMSALKDNALSSVKDIKLTVNADGKKTDFKGSDFKYKFEYRDALEKAKAYTLSKSGKYDVSDGVPVGNSPDVELDYKVTSKSVKEQVKKLAKKVNKDFKNAEIKEFTPFAYDRFTYKEGENGKELDNSDLEKSIKAFFASDKRKGSVTAKVKEIEPKITVEDLEENIVGLSSVTSVSYNTEDGNTNMRLALEACNGSVIEPGGKWSFNECTGDTNREDRGYKKATVIQNRKFEQGVGGGLCQASTTIFQAALFANMTILERHNHYWTSSYAAPGEDATIDYPNLDLRLGNNTEYQMFMECTMDGDTLLVNIYGYQDPSYDNIKVYTENYDIVEKQSYSNRTVRVLYLDHEIVSEETVCTSVYSLTDDYTVKEEDKGTFRVSVYGEVIWEADPVTENESENTEETVAVNPENEYTPDSETTEEYSEPAVYSEESAEGDNSDYYDAPSDDTYITDDSQGGEIYSDDTSADYSSEYNEYQ